MIYVNYTSIKAVKRETVKRMKRKNTEKILANHIPDFFKDLHSEYIRKQTQENQ